MPLEVEWNSRNYSTPAATFTYTQRYHNIRPKDIKPIEKRAKSLNGGKNNWSKIKAQFFTENFTSHGENYP